MVISLLKISFKAFSIGSLGIGLASPDYTLDVKAGDTSLPVRFAANWDAMINLSSSNGSARTGLMMNGQNGNNPWHMNTTSSGTSLAFFHGTNLNTDPALFTMTSDGRLGIGDTGPDAKLEVVGDLMVSATANGDGNRFIVNSSGNVGIGTTSPENWL